MKRAIFVGGCERSGTTVLGSHLGSSWMCITTPESQFLFKSLFDLKNNKTINEISKKVQFNWRFKLWDIDSFSFMSIEDSTCFSEFIYRLVNEYALKVDKGNWSVWVDHTPETIKYVQTLQHNFEGAKFIHIVRDGRAVANSIIPLNWGPNNVIRAAHWWMERLTCGLAAESCFLGTGSIIRVKFEDFLSNPSSVLKRICSFAEIEYSPSMSDQIDFKIPEYSQKQHKLLQAKLEPSRIDGWKDGLTPRQIEIFESITGDLLSYLGYEPLFGIKARKPNRLERIVSGEYEMSPRYIYNKTISKLRIAGQLLKRSWHN